MVRPTFYLRVNSQHLAHRTLPTRFIFASSPSLLHAYFAVLHCVYSNSQFARSRTRAVRTISFVVLVYLLCFQPCCRINLLVCITRKIGELGECDVRNWTLWRSSVTSLSLCSWVCVSLYLFEKIAVWNRIALSRPINFSCISVSSNLTVVCYFFPRFRQTSFSLKDTCSSIERVTRSIWTEDCLLITLEGGDPLR
jgi:hypothetical protein